MLNYVVQIFCKIKHKNDNPKPFLTTYERPDGFENRIPVSLVIEPVEAPTTNLPWQANNYK